MYLISELAKRVGLSRTTLLYYEKLGLIRGHRQDNGYRYYSTRDLEQVTLLQKLHTAGLTLKECQACMQGQLSRDTLMHRLDVLSDEIAHKQQAHALLSAMLGQTPMRQWHESLEQEAPNAHMDWLLKQGFTEKAALRLKWLSKDINQHQAYMADFDALFRPLYRLGPGSDADTLKALEQLPIRSGLALDIGCGKGASTLCLAKHTDFTVTALDNDAFNLQCLIQKAKTQKLDRRINTLCASMTNMPLVKGSVDLIWAEGSAYIMGFETALSQWQAYLKKGAYLVVSDLVWLTDTPAQPVREYWRKNYPGMTSVQARTQQLQRAGYQLLHTYTLSQAAWDQYLVPLSQQLDQQQESDAHSAAFLALSEELQLHKQYLGQYGYQMFVTALNT